MSQTSVVMRRLTFEPLKTVSCNYLWSNISKSHVCDVSTKWRNWWNLSSLKRDLISSKSKSSFDENRKRRKISLSQVSARNGKFFSRNQMSIFKVRRLLQTQKKHHLIAQVWQLLDKYFTTFHVSMKFRVWIFLWNYKKLNFISLCWDVSDVPCFSIPQEADQRYGKLTRWFSLADGICTNFTDIEPKTIFHRMSSLFKTMFHHASENCVTNAMRSAVFSRRHALKTHSMRVKSTCNHSPHSEWERKISSFHSRLVHDNLYTNEIEILFFFYSQLTLDPLTSSAAGRMGNMRSNWRRLTALQCQ